MKTSNDVGILTRIIEPSKPELSPEVARLVLGWRFAEQDQQRMHDLLEKAKNAALTVGETQEAEDYERIGHMLSILKSKARLSLGKTKTAS